MSNIKLSILVPARNEFPNIVHTIYSIIHALEVDGFTEKDFEILVLDNGSDDRKEPSKRGTGGTIDYLRSRGMYWSKVLKTIYYPFAGNHTIRNRGAEIAQGEYIFMSDAHMAYRPGFFKEFIRTVDESGGMVHAVLDWMGAYPPHKGGLGYTIKLGEEIKGCVDEETEILTKDGWKKHNEVSMKTEFITVNPKTKEIESQKPREIVKRKRDGIMYEFTGRSVNQKLTPYHRCPYLSQSDKKDDTWREKTAEEISLYDRLPLGTEGIKKEKTKYPDYFVELIGWIITEGSYSTKRTDERITITQYDKKRNKRIATLADKFGYSWHYSTRGDICIAQKGARKIFQILPEKKLTFELINQLNRKQLELLYEILLDADGTRQPTNETFIQVDQETIDAFQYLCVLVGKQSRQYTRKPDYFKGNHFGKKDIHYVSVKKNKYACDFKIEKKQYKGIVWCPDLPNGSIITRRNGKTMVSFNTWNNYHLQNRDGKSVQDWWYVPSLGHCALGCRRDQFLKFKGYQEKHRCYGGGEFFLDMKWWMLGSCVVVNPNMVSYHLNAGRGYSYNLDDYRYNVFQIGLALGADEWVDRHYINQLRKGQKGVIDKMFEQATKASKPEREFIDAHKIMTFNELLVNRPWEKQNLERHGGKVHSLQIFHPSWIELLKVAPEHCKEAYRNSKLQKGLDKFIREELWDFVYKNHNYDKDKEIII